MNVLMILAVWAAQVATSTPPPQARAFLESDYHPLESLRELPPPLAEAFRQFVHDLPVADRGEPFEASDVVRPGAPPQRRFLAAGTSPSGAFVAYEHGGRGHHYHLLLFGPEVPAPRLLAHHMGWKALVEPAPTRGGKRRPLSSRTLGKRIARDVRRGDCEPSSSPDF